MKNPRWEGIKEILRYVVLYVVSYIVSWFIVQTLAQISNVPEWVSFKLWVFVYNIPFRGLLTFLLTLAGRYVDKYLFIKSKEAIDKKTVNTHIDAEPQGLLWF